MRKLPTLTVAAIALATAGTSTTHAEHGFKQGKPRTWDSYTMYEQHNKLHRYRLKALSVISWFLDNPKYRNTPTGHAKLRYWNKRLGKISTNMEMLHDRIYLANSCYGTSNCRGSWTQRRNMVAEEVCRYSWSCSEAMRVSFCETAGSYLADPGDDPGNPYMGLFELGPSERAKYGRGIYKSSNYHVAKKSGVVDMVWSAHHLYIGEGRGWGPWSCKP
jgi:hypothetical protein